MSAAPLRSTAASGLLLALMLPLAAIGADARITIQPSASSAAPDTSGLVLAEPERFEWIGRARADLAAATNGPGTDGDRQQLAFLRALDEQDPARREVMLHVWLTDYIGPAPAEEPNVVRLGRLLDIEPVLRVRHHDHPEHSRPAFNIAGLARNRINEQQIRLRSHELAREPDSIPAALLSPDEPTEFRAGLLALERLEPTDRAAVFADPLGSVLKRPGGAEATLALVDRGWLAADALLPLIEQADPELALRAFRMSRSQAPELRRRALERALDRPGLGGLPVAEALNKSDAKLRDTAWSLLDEPERGADAALALARHGDELEARIDAEFDHAAPRARLRMLLALRLRDSPSSLALLKQLRSQRLTAAEQRATAAWE
jgi:hypothetical protein